MALVRVYCGLASADETVRSASAAQLTIAVVDDAGRLLGVHEISDDPSGYAQLGTLLVERTSGFTDAAVAADSDDHLVTSLLTAAGRPLVVADDDTTDDFAERFADDDSVDEMQAPPAARRAVGLARALQAGALEPGNLPVPRELVSYKPVLAAHVALLGGRHSAAVALREVLRELYPAALRAYPDPAHPLALAVLDALPEPGRLTANGNASESIAEEVVAELTRARTTSEDEIISAVTALHVAISESPRRGGVNKSLAPAAAETVRQAIAAVRACDAACASLISTLASRSVPSTTAAPSIGRRTSEPASLKAASTYNSRRVRREPAATGNGPVMPHPLTSPPVAPQPMMPPPAAPRPVAPPPAAPAAAFPNRAAAPGNRPTSAPGNRPVSAPGNRPVSAPGNRPVSVPPPPPGMTPITPGSRPSPSTRNPSMPQSPAATGLPSRSPAPSGMPPMSAPTSGMPPMSPAASGLPPVSSSPADSGQPFRATLTNAAINSVRAERQRTVIPSRPSTRPSSPAAAGPTDYSLPMPAQRPAQETPEPGSRANWPLLNNSGEDTAPPLPVTPASAPPADGRVKPPWQDMPKEPPALRLVDTQLGSRLDATAPASEPPPLRLIEGEDRAARRLPSRRTGAGSPTSGNPSSGTTLTALDRSTTPPVPADGNDRDLLIFAAARSAWFTGHTDETNLEWANANDTGWRAAQKAATPEVAAETSAGLPKRVPQANLVPGSPLRDERPLRIVRDAASIAAHTTGYFRGWRRGQEIGGFAMGGRPGRESAGGWDFTRDGQAADDDYRNNTTTNAGYRSS